MSARGPMTSDKPCDHYDTNQSAITPEDGLCYLCGQRFVPVPDGAEATFLDAGRASSSDLECDGKPWQHELKCDVSQKFHFCPGCDARYVPSDVLEECRNLLDTLQEGGEWHNCASCGADLGKHLDWCELAAMLRRIDAVLGNAPPGRGTGQPGGTAT